VSQPTVLSTALAALNGYEATNHNSNRTMYALQDAVLAVRPLRTFEGVHGRVWAMTGLDTLSTTRGVPGDPAIIAVTLRKDLLACTYTLYAMTFPTEALATCWLASRGIPLAKLKPSAGYARMTDELSHQMERRIIRSADRFDVLDHRTTRATEREVWVLFRDLAPEGKDPYLLQVETTLPDSTTYTVREGRFATQSGARDWISNRPGPLPSSDWADLLPPAHTAMRLSALHRAVNAARATTAAA